MDESSPEAILMQQVEVAVSPGHHANGANGVIHNLGTEVRAAMEDVNLATASAFLADFYADTSPEAVADRKKMTAFLTKYPSKEVLELATSAAQKINNVRLDILTKFPPEDINSFRHEGHDEKEAAAADKHKEGLRTGLLAAMDKFPDGDILLAYCGNLSSPDVVAGVPELSKMKGLFSGKSFSPEAQKVLAERATAPSQDSLARAFTVYAEEMTPEVQETLVRNEQTRDAALLNPAVNNTEVLLEILPQLPPLLKAALGFCRGKILPKSVVDADTLVRDAHLAKQGNATSQLAVLETLQTDRYAYTNFCKWLNRATPAIIKDIEIAIKVIQTLKIPSTQITRKAWWNNFIELEQRVLLQKCPVEISNRK